jgi:hypothetical protein
LTESSFLYAWTTASVSKDKKVTLLPIVHLSAFLKYHYLHNWSTTSETNNNYSECSKSIVTQKYCRNNTFSYVTQLDKYLSFTWSFMLIILSHQFIIDFDMLNKINNRHIKRNAINDIPSSVFGYILIKRSRKDCFVVIY